MRKNNLKSDVIFSIACLLLCSFLLHTLLFNHQHPAFMGDGIQTAVHGEDKKWLGALAVAFIFFVANRERRPLEAHHHTPRAIPENAVGRTIPNRRDPNLSQIASGIIHSKIYA